MEPSATAAQNQLLDDVLRVRKCFARERVISLAHGKRFHPLHFVCKFCKCVLGGAVAYKEKNEDAYCEKCHNHLYG